MTTKLSAEQMYKLVDNALRTPHYVYIAHTVAMRFRSMHYLSSKLVCACVLLNLVLNDEITPNSADHIITCMRRRTKSLYTTIDNAYIIVEDDFIEYAKSILGSEYDILRDSKMRNANFIVYVISREIRDSGEFDRSSFFGSLDIVYDTYF